MRSFFLEAASVVGLGAVSAGEAVRGAGLAALVSGFAGSVLAGSVFGVGAGSILGVSDLAGAESKEAVAALSPLWEAKMLLVLPLVELTSRVPVPTGAGRRCVGAIRPVPSATPLPTWFARDPEWRAGAAGSQCGGLRTPSFAPPMGSTKRRTCMRSIQRR